MMMHTSSMNRLCMESGTKDDQGYMKQAVTHLIHPGIGRGILRKDVFQSRIPPELLLVPDTRKRRSCK